MPRTARPAPIGMTYGRWQVIGEASKDRFGQRVMRCRCICGAVHAVRLDKLRARSHGCVDCARKDCRKASEGNEVYVE